MKTIPQLFGMDWPEASVLSILIFAFAALIIMLIVGLAKFTYEVWFRKD